MSTLVDCKESLNLPLLLSLSHFLSILEIPFYICFGLIYKVAECFFCFLLQLSEHSICKKSC